jgi:hypothetical protein
MKEQLRQNEQVKRSFFKRIFSRDKTEEEKVVRKELK